MIAPIKVLVLFDKISKHTLNRSVSVILIIMQICQELLGPLRKAKRENYDWVIGFNFDSSSLDSKTPYSVIIPPVIKDAGVTSKAGL